MSIKIHTPGSDLRHLFKTKGYVAVQGAIDLKELQKVQDDMKRLVKLTPFKIGVESDFDTGIKSMNKEDLHPFRSLLLNFGVYIRLPIPCRTC